MTDDELERRKEETWGMSEIRGSNPAKEDSEGSSPKEDASDTVDTEETEAAVEVNTTSDTAVSEDTKRGSDTADTVQADDTADIEDAPNTSVTSDGVDHEDTANQSAIEDTSDTAEPNDTPVSKERTTGETVREMALDSEAKGLAVRDLHNVNVYLYEDIHEEMVSTFKTLDAEYYQTHGDDLSKNKDFFNAIFRAGLASPRLREELELEK